MSIYSGRDMRKVSKEVSKRNVALFGIWSWTKHQGEGKW